MKGKVVKSNSQIQRQKGKEGLVRPREAERREKPAGQKELKKVRRNCP